MLETMITELTEDSTSLERKLLSEKDEWNVTRASLEESIRQKNTQIEELTSQLLATNLKISETEAQTTEFTKSKETVISNLRKEIDQLQNELDKAKIAHAEELQNLKDAHNDEAKKLKEHCTRDPQFCCCELLHTFFNVFEFISNCPAFGGKFSM